jgi:8-oxo-dGTP pyrophosphatase MutT (NUDIX family)
MQKKFGPWTIKKTIKKYQDHWMEVFEDEIIAPNGKEGILSTVNFLPRVCVLPVDENKFVYLKDDFCYTVGDNILAAIGSSIDEGEEPLAAAKREMEEELLLKSDSWLDFGMLIPAFTVIKQPMYLFGATDLKSAKIKALTDLEPGVIKMSLEKAINMVMEAKIFHAPTVALILKAEKYLNSGSGAKYDRLHQISGSKERIA